MSKITREINKISLFVISTSGRIILYGLAAILIVTGARSAYSFGHGIFYAPAMEAEPGTEKSVKLTGNESVEEVGKILKKAGLIRDPRTFTIQAKCYGYEVKAGDACFPCQDPGSRNGGGVFSAFDGVCNAGKLPDHDNRKI